MSNIFFTSDTHFSDANALRACGIIYRDSRPFKNVKQMDRCIIHKWNKKAKKGDIIYHLGDFINYNKYDTLSWKKSIKLVKKIKADVILIMGNQEYRLVDDFFNLDIEKFKTFAINMGFKDVLEDACIDVDGLHLHLNHYPVNSKKDYFNLFGHIHKSNFAKKYGFNVGVDCFHFNLYSIDDVKKVIHDMNKFYDKNVYSVSLG